MKERKPDNGWIELMRKAKKGKGQKVMNKSMNVMEAKAVCKDRKIGGGTVIGIGYVCFSFSCLTLLISFA